MDVPFDPQLGSPSPVAVAPSFHMLRAQPPPAGALLLGGVASSFALAAVLLALGRPGHAHAARRAEPGPPSPAAAGPAVGVPSPGEDSDTDFDTIVLGDPADAPAPVRKGDHVSDVHPFRIVHLPRFGEASGLIPDTAAGHALYTWLAAFNHADRAALAAAITTADPEQTAAAEIELRRETGGFALLSAREVAPGIMVFRVRDQTTQTEALGTVQLRAASPPVVASFSLRAVAAH